VCRQRQIEHELRKYERALVHGGFGRKSAKNPKSDFRRSNRDQTETEGAERAHDAARIHQRANCPAYMDVQLKAIGFAAGGNTRNDAFGQELTYMGFLQGHQTTRFSLIIHCHLLKP
jgi:hypothetical protein